MMMQELKTIKLSPHLGPVPSCHLKNSPESSLSALHMLQSLWSFRKRKCLNHALDVMNLCEPDCLFTVKSVA